MIHNTTSNTIEEEPSHFSRSAIRSRVSNPERHPHLSQMYTSLKKVKESLLEKSDHQEKKPQDGKTNPME